MSEAHRGLHFFNSITQTQEWMSDPRFQSLIGIIESTDMHDNFKAILPDDVWEFVVKWIKVPEFIRSINVSIRKTSRVTRILTLKDFYVQYDNAISEAVFLDTEVRRDKDKENPKNFTFFLPRYTYGGFTTEAPNSPNLVSMKARLDELENVPEDVCQEAIGAIGVIIDDAKSPTPHIAKNVLRTAGTSGAWVERIEEERTASLQAPPPLPEKAPALWATDKQKGDTPVTFIQRHYAPWLGKGLSRPDIRQLDPQLYMALANWLRGNPLPEGFDLPTKKQVTDSIAEKAGLTVRPTDDGPNQHAHLIARAADALRKRHPPR